MFITIRQGTEGPRHDPYGYEEVTVEQGEVETTAHIGLSVFVKHDGKVMNLRDDTRIDSIMSLLCGVSVTQAKRWDRKRYEAHLRVHRSHGGITWVPGHPGETLVLCKCGDVVDTMFNRAAIE